jgi:glutamate/tyrosine decarboxylase-like PLP-dependent enzyme
MAFDVENLDLLIEAVRSLEVGFEALPDVFGDPDRGAMRQVLGLTAERLRDNYPYHHPLYIGQMLKPPHPVARLAYALAMCLNPNNHALDGGRATSRMEKESVAELARMFGWGTHLGHLCGGGTIANFEALWVARSLRPGLAIAASELAHYTHSRLASVLEVPFVPIAVDERGRMDLGDLERKRNSHAIGTLVATVGTTAAGTVDPLDDILLLCKQHNIRVHVDAAYGGYFMLAGNLHVETRNAFSAVGAADSLVIDPHKHGLQPYGCGCVLFQDPSVGRFYQHASPYTYFTSDELHLGEISLECSRAGASAAALWATMRLLPLEKGGAFGRSLEACRDAARALHEELEADARFAPLFPPQLDIVVWSVRSARSSESSRLARQIFDAAARVDLHLALATFPRAMAEPTARVEIWDSEDLVCLRACAIKPEHRDWMPQIIERLRSATAEVLGVH